MCYFEQTRWACGFWKWGNFKQQCTKEYRIGETCGLKLVYDTTFLPYGCKMCEQIEKKNRRIQKMTQDIERWLREGNRMATIERTQENIQEIQGQIQNIWNQHQARAQSV